MKKIIIGIGIIVAIAVIAAGIINRANAREVVVGTMAVGDVRPAHVTPVADVVSVVGVPRVVVVEAVVGVTKPQAVAVPVHEEVKA